MLSVDCNFFERAFGILNNVYFSSTLPRVVITIQTSPKSHGYITVNKIWKDNQESYREINISAETINRPLENVMATLLHEMIHLHCMENSINDTSKGGRYHNKTFKAEAEKRNLHIAYDKYIGYSLTSPTEEFIRILKSNGLYGENIEHHRITVGGGGSSSITGKKAVRETYTLLLNRFRTV